VSYLVEWSVRRRTSGTVEVESLDDIPRAMLGVIMDEDNGVTDLAYDGEDGLRYELTIGPVYEVKRVPYKEDDIWTETMPLVEAEIARLEAQWARHDEDRERRQLAALLAKYGDS
jgi:hypothetical protein